MYSINHFDNIHQVFVLIHVQLFYLIDLLVNLMHQLMILDLNQVQIYLIDYHIKNIKVEIFQVNIDDEI